MMPPIVLLAEYGVSEIRGLDFILRVHFPIQRQKTVAPNGH